MLLVYTVLPGVPERGFGGVPLVNGARAWISFGSFSLQPAELMKIAFVSVMARYLRYRSNYRSLLGLMAPFALAMAPLLVILKQPDLGTALVFIPALFAVLYVAGAKAWHLLAIMGMGMCLGTIAWFAGTDDEGVAYSNIPGMRHLPTLIKPYQRGRVYAVFSNDEARWAKFGYQQQRAMLATGSGGWAGKGLGNIPVGQGVPEAHNDFVFSLIAEQFGFIGSVIVIVAYIVLFAAGVEIAGSTREPFGRLVALGIVSLLAGQAFLNLMVAMRLMPVTGVTLPFVSYGGSSLLASFIAAGLLLNIGQNRTMVIGRKTFDE
jgi:cell division protein FtsW (lipid II flippase)